MTEIIRDLQKIFQAHNVGVRGYWHAGKLYIFRDVWGEPGTLKPHPQYYADGMWHDCEEASEFADIEPWLSADA